MQPKHTLPCAATSAYICRVDEAGVISTFAGNGEATFAGDGTLAISASLNMPTAINFGPTGVAYISDTTNARVRTVDANQTITTYAGDGTPAYDGDGKPATEASLFLPMQTAFDAAGNLHIADFNNHVSRRFEDQACLSIPYAMCR